MRPSSAKVICFAAAPGTFTTLSSMVNSVGSTLRLNAGELENLFPQPGGRAVDGADIVEMKIIAAVRRGDAPG